MEMLRVREYKSRSIVQADIVNKCIREGESSGEKSVPGSGEDPAAHF